MQVTYTVGDVSPDNLWQLVQDYCETSETNFVTDIPKFVQAAEARIYNTVDLPVLRNNVTGTASVGVPYLSAPTGWLATYSLAVIDGSGNYNYLLNKDVNFIRESFPAPTTQGMPTHYAVFDSNTFLLGPTPDSGYTFELHYKAYPVSIVTAVNTWLGDNFGEVLLYGTIREAYSYQKGEQDTAAKYDALYMESLSNLKLLGDGADHRDAYRSGQLRVPQQ